MSATGAAAEDTGDGAEGPAGADPLAEAAARLDDAELRYYSGPAEALRLADEAVALLGAAAPLGPLARARRVRGVALALTGRHAEALTELRAALALVPDDDPRLRCKVLRGLAIACDEAGALEQSLAWSLRAAEVARALGDPAQLAGTLLSVGVSLSRTGNPEAGLARYREALALYEQTGDPGGRAERPEQHGHQLAEPRPPRGGAAAPAARDRDRRRRGRRRHPRDRDAEPRRAAAAARSPRRGARRAARGDRAERRRRLPERRVPGPSAARRDARRRR
ncbi:MAG: tetratricopeptide repeat protein [Comamonadaceae bacterium]|nr:tetratricopeptide repeat protein [Comamonadaceae bacterium]